MSDIQAQPVEPTLDDHGQVRRITVTVNGQPVVFRVREATGSQIKETAIAQGVPIQSDFALFEVTSDGKLRPIRDDENIKLHEHQQFRAVAPDDNS